MNRDVLALALCVCLSAQRAIEFASIAFRKGLARWDEGCVQCTSPKDRSRCTSILS